MHTTWRAFQARGPVTMNPTGTMLMEFRRDDARHNLLFQLRVERRKEFEKSECSYGTAILNKMDIRPATGWLSFGGSVTLMSAANIRFLCTRGRTLVTCTALPFSLVSERKLSLCRLGTYLNRLLLPVEGIFFWSHACNFTCSKEKYVFLHLFIRHMFHHIS